MSERRRLKAGVESEEEPESVSKQAILAGAEFHMSDFIDRRIANLERIWTATMEDLAARIEALENMLLPQPADEPRVTSTSGDGIVFNYDMDDIRVSDEPGVEDVLEWLDDPLNDMLMGRHRYAARIIPSWKLVGEGYAAGPSCPPRRWHDRPGGGRMIDGRALRDFVLVMTAIGVIVGVLIGLAIPVAVDFVSHIEIRPAVEVEDGQ